MNKLTEVLIRAKELLEIPEAWVRGKVFDNDIGGDNLYTSAPAAKQYCVYGAVWKAARELGMLKPGERHFSSGFGHSPLGILMEDAVKALPDVAATYNNAAQASNNGGVKVAKQVICKAIELSVDQDDG